MAHKLSGRLDMNTCSELARTLFTLQATPLELDFSAACAVDSAALALIFELQRKSYCQGQTLQLTGLPEGLYSLAHLYGIEDLIMPLVSKR